MILVSVDRAMGRYVQRENVRLKGVTVYSLIWYSKVLSFLLKTLKDDYWTTGTGISLGSKNSTEYTARKIEPTLGDMQLF